MHTFMTSKAFGESERVDTVARTLYAVRQTIEEADLGGLERLEDYMNLERFNLWSDDLAHGHGERHNREERTNS